MHEIECKKKLENLSEEEKHKPENIQVIPRCFNHGKGSIDSNEKFILEFKKRNFKIDFTGHDIILHDNYSSSYFYNLFN